MFTRRQTLLGGLSAGIMSPALGQMETTGDGIFVIPIRMTSERLWTFVKLTPEEQYVAIFDTGASSSIIAAQLANRLKLSGVDFDTLTEGLGGSETGRYVELKKPSIGGVFNPDSWWFLTSKTLDKQHFKLLIGSRTLLEYDSEFDLTKAEWRIHTKGNLNFEGYFKVEDSFKKTSQLNRNWSIELQLECTVAGLSGNFQFDTGSPTNFLLDGQATAKLGIWDSEQPFAPWRVGGFGPNHINTRLYRLDSASVHGVTLDKPLVMLSDPARSTSHVAGLDGLLGLKAIRHFNFLVDSNGKALWLKPNGLNFGDHDGRYPMSGLWLEQAKNAIVVDEVGIGSPAALAGIMVGDHIVSTDWQTIMTQINGDAGEEVSILVDRDGKRIEAKFTLQPYL